jgi:hypothetical protein
MSADDNAGSGNEDLKAKMREAHGPAGGPKMHRRKAGGGGA